MSDNRLFYERAYHHLIDNYDNLSQPTVVVISTQRLDTCDRVQEILNGSQPGYVIANYVTLNSSGSVINRQLLLLSPQHVNCSGCTSTAPLRSSLGVCTQLYAGTRVAFGEALYAICEALMSASEQSLSMVVDRNLVNQNDVSKLFMALAEVVRTTQGRYQCTGITATKRLQ